MTRILIVEDDGTLNELLCMHLKEKGYQPRGVFTADEARAALHEWAPDAVLLDHQLPDGTGLDMLAEIKASGQTIPVIMITGVNDIGLPIEAIKQGAYDFIRKPMDDAELEASLHNALETRRLSRKVAALSAAIEQPISLADIVGQSRAVTEIAKTVGKVARTNATVLITGESGTGKEVVARAIHHHSECTGPFLPINCSAIVETLLESELFGHEKGSFTGAIRTKAGKMEAANEGTLFLDEIGEMSLPLQAKLLRVLQDRSFERVGSNKTLHTSARILAATNRDLTRLVAEGAFREDLYYRLDVISIHLPPLREHIEDLRPLVEHLLTRINASLHRNGARISQAAWNLMNVYGWPGNIRELENVLTRAVVLAHDNVLTADVLGISPSQARSVEPAPDKSTDPGEPALLTLDELEARHVRAVLEYTHWHKGRACQILGISRPALERRIERYRLLS